MFRYFVVLCSFLFVCSCTRGLSEEEAIERFEDALVGKQSCEIDAHCTIIQPGCPLGCNVSVNTNYTNELQDLAAELVEKYNAGNQGCDYGCLVAYPVCVIDRCESREL